MARPLKEIREIQFLNNDCPVLCAGDIFHRWNSPPELINFAIENLPDNFYAIPGQHDLPLHNYDDIKRSAYWTLVKSGNINYMHPDTPTKTEDDTKKQSMISFGYPYGHKIKSVKHRTDDYILIALIHEYCWIKGTSYPNAPKENMLRLQGKNIINNRHLGYDVIVYGDNHIDFSTKIGKTEIWNCGSLMRRNADQLEYAPKVGLLLADGSITPHYLDTSQDKYLDLQSASSGNVNDLDMKAFIVELEKLGDTKLDFTEAMKQYLQKNKIAKPVQNIIMKGMEL